MIQVENNKRSQICAMIGEDGTNNSDDLGLSKRGAARKSRRIMKDHPSTMRKTIGWAALAYGAFTIISVVGPIVLERFWSRRR
jgi:hypothetical protein